MSNIQKIKIEGERNWRWRVTDVNEKKIKAQLQRRIWLLRWITVSELEFLTDLIKRPYKICESREYWFKHDLDLYDRLESRWKQFCKTHKV